MCPLEFASRTKYLNFVAHFRKTPGFMEHLEGQDHIDNDSHQSNLDSLEAQFRCNNAGPRQNIFLSCRNPWFSTPPGGASLWDRNKASELTYLYESVQQEAALFKCRYETDVQFIFSHVQHHWHTRNAKGEREPPKHCRPKGSWAVLQFFLI